MKRLAGLIILLLFTVPATADQSEIVIDDFERGLAPGWNVRSFTGLNDYRVVMDGANHVMSAASNATASSLYFEKKIDLNEFPVLSWRWKIEQTVPGGDVLSAATDDYPARIYIVFPHWYYPKTRAINYIWANKLPKGESAPNPYTQNSRMIAVESGNDKAGQWVSEQRNVYEDYRALFGEKPRLVKVIAIMTDSDNTGTSSRAWFDDIRFSQEEN